MKKLVMVSLLVGCGSEGDSKFIDGFNPPAPADDEIQIVAPPTFGVPPGADITLCAYIDERVSADTDIIHYKGYQSAVGGHHAILYAVQQAQAANVHECTEDDMVNSRYLAGGGADSQPIDLPDGVVIRIPANTQLMVQTHWINATDAPIDGQGAFNLKVTAPKPEHVIAQLVSVVNTSFVLPKGKSTVTTECTVAGQKLNAFVTSGHMHQRGSHISITHTPVGSATGTKIYETDWSEDDVFDSPKVHYPPGAPFVLTPGDKLRVDCEFDNNTGAELSFPSEMCLGWSFAYPMTQQINCTDGNWPI
jgi:hypothetical protein